MILLLQLDCHNQPLSCPWLPFTPIDLSVRKPELEGATKAEKPTWCLYLGRFLRWIFSHDAGALKGFGFRNYFNCSAVVLRHQKYLIMFS